MMVSKPKRAALPDAEKYPRKAIACQSGPSVEEQGRSFAKLITSAELAGYRVIGAAQPKNLADQIDTPTLLATLRDQAAAVQGGDLAHAEAMLMNQATSLQALYVRLTERALEQSHMPNLEAFMRLALRAQSQCRATVETLAAIKNPPIVYARQANISNGPQQVNNGVSGAVSADAHAGEKALIQQPEQLESSDGERVDAGTAGTAGRGHPTVEAVGAEHRPEDARG
jgi:hypothetical protein